MVLLPPGGERLIEVLRAETILAMGLTPVTLRDAFLFYSLTSVRRAIVAVVSGLLRGSRLTAIPSGDYFWFAWAVFRPETRIWR